jgi:hypothetical protein
MPNGRCEEVASRIERTWVMREESQDPQKQLQMDVRIDQWSDWLERNCEGWEEMLQAIRSKVESSVPSYE